VLLQERLPGSSIADPLFELLVIRRELAKEQLAKNEVSDLRGNIKELSDLINLFKPASQKAAEVSASP
jgi:hypothetical protein